MPDQAYLMDDDKEGNGLFIGYFLSFNILVYNDRNLTNGER